MGRGGGGKEEEGRRRREGGKGGERGSAHIEGNFEQRIIDR